MKLFIANTPLCRRVGLENIANAAIILALDDTALITGEQNSVSGRVYGF